MPPTVNFSSPDVLVSAANILYAPLGTALPAAATIAWNAFTTWPTNWVHLGYTATPARLAYSYDPFEVFVEQITAPIVQRKNNERATIALELSQFDANNLTLLTDGTATVTAPGVGTKGFTKIATGGSTNLKEYIFALEGYRPDSTGTPQAVRVFLYRATIRIDGDIQFAKAGATTLPAVVTGLGDSGKAIGQNLMEIHVVTSPGT